MRWRSGQCTLPVVAVLEVIYLHLKSLGDRPLGGSSGGASPSSRLMVVNQ
ncbi:hypothetical protein [Scytonema sp. HK-05]|nr:hypothetical protein [Scytonema sp. HK-05]